MYDYTIQKLTQAIICLAEGKEDIRIRLVESYIYYLHVLIHNNDFPKELLPQRKQIVHDISNRKGLQWNENDKISIEYNGLLQTIWKKRNKSSAQKIIKRIIHLREQLSKIEVNKDFILNK